MTALKRKLATRRSNNMYAIYAYHKPSNQNDPHGRWERQFTTKNYKFAKKKAKTLHLSKQFAKVELHCRQKQACPINLPKARIIKTYGEPTGMIGFAQNLRKILPELIIGTAMLVAFFFTL